MHTKTIRENVKKERERERTRRDWGAHVDFIDLSIDGATVDEVGHIDCSKHLASWQYHMSSVN